MRARDRRVFVDGRLDHCIDERFAHRGKIILGIEGIGNGSVLEIGVGGSAIVIHHPAKGEDHEGREHKDQKYDGVALGEGPEDTCGGEIKKSSCYSANGGASASFGTTKHRDANHITARAHRSSEET